MTSLLFLLLRRTGYVWRHLLPLKCWWAPRLVYIEPTNTCNLKCDFCPQSSSQQQRGFMEFDLFKSTVDETPRSSHVHLYSRGEPMLHPQIAKMSHYVKQHGNGLTICTNGLLPLNGVVADRIVFNGIAAEVDTVKSAIGKFNTVVLELLEYDPKRVQQALDVGAVVYIKKLFQWSAPCKTMQHVTMPCLQPWITLSVFYDGSVVPCCADFEGTLVVGNLYSESLWDIWNGPKMRELRRRLRSGLYNCVDSTALLKPYEVVRK